MFGRITNIYIYIPPEKRDGLIKPNIEELDDKDDIFCGRARKCRLPLVVLFLY